MSDHHSEIPLSRRELLKAFGVASAVAAVPDLGFAEPAPPPNAAPAATMMGVPFERHPTVRIAIVGTGLRGSSVLNEFLAVEGVRITALCDTVPEKAKRAAARVVQA